ncbi:MULTISPECIES: hypothetical protein [unclassified Streptomyces]|uniref:hypothetical protein n=1 Tax=unclassified Streptomyces TaxID=2593676 RepID=UPI003BB579C1
MPGPVHYPETGADKTPIYRLVVTRTSAGPIGGSFEVVYTHHDLEPNGPDLTADADTVQSWSVMLKDSFEWVNVQWAVVEQANTASARLEVIAAKVNGSVVDFFTRTTITQPPVY